MLRRPVFLILVSGMLALLSACSSIMAHWTYRYRLTVEVERAGKIYSGSSVIEVRRDQNINGIGARVKGEAVAIDVGREGTLFALLWGRRQGEAWPYSVVHNAFADRLGTVNMVDVGALSHLENLTGANATLSPNEYPMLVRFRNIKDPRTIESLHYDMSRRNIENNFQINRIYIEMSSEPVTEKILQKLPWLHDHRGSMDYDGKIHPRNPEKDITSSAFIRGQS